MKMQQLIKLFLLFCILVCLANVIETQSSGSSEQNEELPTVVIALLVRNKAHALPHVLTYLEHLNYDKERIALWIRCDHSTDKSEQILRLWLKNVAEDYHSVDYAFDNATDRYHNESSPYDWPVQRFEHLIKLKEEVFTFARHSWADYIFFLDADVLLTHSDTLKYLVELKLPIVAPMLLSEGLYSNFWCGMTTDYYYERTEEYKEIYYVKKQGVFKVPMVHSAVLVNMNYVATRQLTFDREKLLANLKQHRKYSNYNRCNAYTGPIDDIIIFAISANCSNLRLHVNNEMAFGYIFQPLEVMESFQDDLQRLWNIRANVVYDLGVRLEAHSYFQPYLIYPERHKLTLDHIYMINLKRRPERRKKMELLFEELGLDVEYFAAVDGKNLTIDSINRLGIEFLPGYEDPYHHRQMTYGEIGCFLSHYYIWQKIVKNEQKEVLILEDDIRFEPYFKQKAEEVLKQARKVVEYDLIYLGRKRLKEDKEPLVVGAKNLVHVHYSYWTLGYVVSLQGARKLLEANPLKNLLPVDEYLPIMFNRHPNTTWSQAYPMRNLVAFSAAPLLMYPTHYTGDEGYISDTEDSSVTNESKLSTYTKDESPEYKLSKNSITNNLDLSGKGNHYEL